MIPSADASASASTRRSLTERFAARLRWHHFYFLLAGVDLVVIATSLLLYHRTLQSYEICLAEEARLEQMRAWSSELRAVVVALNAPGNDIFESRDLATERERFETSLTRLRAIEQRAPELGIDLGEFRTAIQGMIDAERVVLSLFDRTRPGALEPAPSDPTLSRAGAVMAAMDRAQADALEALLRIEGRLRLDERDVLARYGRELEQWAAIEKYLVAVLLLILIGILWYGRKLHALQQRMELQQRRIAAEHTERMAAIGELCTSFAHAMRSPLSSIRAVAEVSQTSAGGRELRAFSDIVDAVDRLDGRMKRLLDFSRPFEPHFDQVDLIQLIEDVIEVVRPRALCEGIEVRLTTERPSLTLQADSALLESAIEELISNARHAMPEGGKVELHVAVERGSAVVRVSDQGSGMSPLAKERLFDLFFTTRHTGSGMGLPAVRRAVELHGGTVELLRTSSSGTVFEVRLPMSSAATR